MIRLPARLLLVFSLLLLTASCVPTLKEPLTNEKNSRIDKRMIGRWRGKSEKKGSGFTVRRLAGTNNTLEIIDGSENQKQRLYATKLGDLALVSYSSVMRGKSQHFLAWYEFSKDARQMHVYPLKLQTIAEAIAARKLTGRVITERASPFSTSKVQFKEVHVNESAKILTTLIKKHGKRWFVEKGSDLEITYVRD